MRSKRIVETYSRSCETLLGTIACKVKCERRPDGVEFGQNDRTTELPWSTPVQTQHPWETIKKYRDKGRTFKASNIMRM
jgi:hypothetical protein